MNPQLKADAKNHISFSAMSVLCCHNIGIWEGFLIEILIELALSFL